MVSSTVSQFWLPPELKPEEFARSFNAYFFDGKAKHYELVDDAHPPNVPDGSHYFELEVPTDRMDEFLGFLRDFAARHDCEIDNFPADGFGYSHSG